MHASTEQTVHTATRYVLIDECDELGDAISPMNVWHFDTEDEAREHLDDCDPAWAERKTIVAVTTTVTTLEDQP